MGSSATAAALAASFVVLFCVVLLCAGGHKCPLVHNDSAALGHVHGSRSYVVPCRVHHDCSAGPRARGCELTHNVVHFDPVLHGADGGMAAHTCLQ